MAALSHILVEALSNDTHTRDSAFSLLQSHKQANPSQYLLDLSSHLSAEILPASARQLAALSVKNCLKNTAREDGLRDFWEVLSPDARETVKTNALIALNSPSRDVRSTAAQLVATIAVLELSHCRWPDSVDMLVANSTHADTCVRQAAILTLGYILEELPSGTLPKTQCDKVMTALYANICSEQPPAEVTIAAVKALGCALQFAAGNFANTQERNVIFRMLVTSCAVNHSDIRVVALENLCEAASYYYDYLSGYVSELWNVTKPFISREWGKEGVLAIEFWSIVSEIEAMREEEEEDRKPVFGIASQITTSVCPLLCEIFLADDQEREEWTIQKSAGALLITLAEVVGDPVVDLCLRFIGDHLETTSTTSVEAGLLVFGSILEGPSEEKLEGLVRNGLPAVLSHATSSNFHVKKAALWTLSRLCEFRISQLTAHPSGASLLSVLLSTLKDHSDVAVLSCSSLAHLLKQCAGTGMFTPAAFHQLFTELLQVALRAAGDLQLAAFTALQTMLEEVTAEFEPIFAEKFQVLLNLFRESLLSPQANSHSFQSLLCGTLQIVCSKTSPELLSDTTLREASETVIGHFRARGCVSEEGLNFIGALVSKAGGRIAVYIPALWDSVLAGLSSSDFSLCKSAVICVGDFARSFEDRSVEFLPTALPALMQVLALPAMTTDVKIQAIAAIGDLASSAKGGFVACVGEVMKVVETAAEASLMVVSEEENVDLFENLQELREVIVDFFSSVVQGVSEAGQESVLLPHVSYIMKYISQVVADVYCPTPSLHMAVLGLLGDLSLSFESHLAPMLLNPKLLQYVKGHESSTDAKLRSIAKWTLKQLKSLSSD